MASLIEGHLPNNALYQGNYAKAKDRRFLIDHNIQLVINVASIDPIVGQETKHYDRLFSELQIKTLRLPWDDCDEFEEKLDIKDLQDAICAIDNMLLDGCSVLVHCRQGKSRSGTLTVAYIMAKKHMNVEDALTYVKERREVAHPNQGFIHWLQIHTIMIHEMSKMLSSTSSYTQPSQATVPLQEANEKDIKESCNS
eukprot:gnl/MRDRNA2_/MRDRNA2_88102_c0_seq1.p1 gnl/MRDRNA2_/MRDRNA2_88102_c0~~gnl/MRDRNA2_/MRDRNA2_88102_c0_seq1.p1  ORF type:complete len:197 (+),score=36.57 gnl/MRDRNA2_/MRDRNA2_88102_c0_seq1:55-645(+)